MDENEMTGEQENILLELGSMLMYNNRMEADAVKGYTDQLNLIRKTKELCSDIPELMELLDKLESETEEKTQDELNHGHSLFEEYTELTGIRPKED